MMNTAREHILARIRSALTVERTPEKGGDAAPPVTRQWTRAELKAEFEKRWTAIGGHFYEADSIEKLHDILRLLLGPFSGAKACMTDAAAEVFPGLEALMIEAGVDITPPDPDHAHEAAVGVTAAEAALAYSGSLMVSSRNIGELGASLLPPMHVALIPAGRIIYGVDEALAIIGTDGHPPRGAVLITGPSRTADIELTLVKGVHGCGVTHAVVLDF